MPSHKDKLEDKLGSQFGQSLDLVKENIKILKRLFPDIVREGKTGGKIDFDRLREILGEEIDTEEEPYSFTWHGKRAALRLAQTPSMGTLRPCKEESVDWENTQNLMIEGDNLEVLKLLQKSYYGKIKMIYIDPPYNTGNDFVYRDAYKAPLAHYLEETGQIDEAGRKTSTNTNTSGRYHTNWLNMIYPRLRLARNLLRNDGVIFISIDDNEQANLKKLCDEVFGSENFISCIPRVAKRVSDQGTYFRPTKDYILAYAKNINQLPEFGVLKDIQERDYALTDENGCKYKQGNSLYKSSLDPLRGCPNQRYYIKAPDGSLIIPPGNVFPPEKKDGAKVKPLSNADKVWRWSAETYLQNKDKIMFSKGSDKNPLLDENGTMSKWGVYQKVYYDEDIHATLHPEDVFYKFENFRATKELKELDIPFDYAKFTGMVCYFLSIMQNIKPLDLILDFFAGSGTTGHAVMRLNAEHEAKSEETLGGGGKNGARFILVQLPEPCAEKSEAYQAGYRTIADICKERLRRAGRKIQEENPDKNLDVGFRVFKLDSSNIKPWDPTFETLEEDLIANVDNIKHDRSSDDLLFELLLKYGLDLSLPIETRVLAGKKVYVLGGGALMVCLDKDVSMRTIEGIGQLKETLSPDIIRVVFRDHCFENDVIKTNALLTLKQRYAITDIKSL